ncbi:hypothetical protein ACSSV9_14135 [Melioribacter sp. OK-6-Me]|uniref:hypothetical protein n=1 Tax=Melioribacter sp. OK-6-Me TaxID=3423433 RepID=UPI003EDB2BED
MKKFKLTKNETLQLYALFVISVLIIYKTPQIIGTVFQIILLIAFWRSKRDYFWLAFVFIISSEPGFLFSNSDAVHSFSLLSNSPFGNLYFNLVLIIVAFLKYFQKKRKVPIFLKTNFVLIFSYFIIQIIAFGFYKTTATIRMTLPWLLLFILPNALKDEKQLFSFFRLIFSFVFFVLITQIYKIVTGLEFSTFFGGMASEVVDAPGGIEEVEAALRPVYGIFIPFIALWGSIYYLTIKNEYFNKKYLNSILVLSVFSIYITATRSWLIASLFLAGFYILVSVQNPLKTFIQIATSAIFIISLMMTLPVLKKQVELSLERYETLEYFLKGDITAGGTVQRFDVRAKRPMEGFRENPIIGWGIGDEYQQYGDGHVGYHNLLMSSGLIGFTLWMLLWGNFIKKMLEKYQRLKKGKTNKNVPLVLISFSLSILIIHTSVQWFGYLIGFNNAFAIALLFMMGQRVFYYVSTIESIERNYKTNVITETS